MKKNIHGGAWIKFLIAVVIILLGYFLRLRLDRLYEESTAVSESGTVTEYSDGKWVGRELSYAENVPSDHPLLQLFRKDFPDTEVILACEEDLTDDGRRDLVILYSLLSDKAAVLRYTPVWLTVAENVADGVCRYTEPIRAPVENQKIHFKNIDQKEEIEFVLQGSKGERIGYGIFRVMDDKTVNLYGEGMEEC